MAKTDIETTAPAAEDAPSDGAAQDQAGSVVVTCDHSGFAPGIGVQLTAGRSSYAPADAAALVMAGLGKVSKSDRTRLVTLNLITDSKE